MKLDITILIIPVSVLAIASASGCDGEFNLYDNYGHACDITCKGLDQTNLALLEDITVANEMSLRVQNSTFQNVSSRIFHRVAGLRYLYLENSTFTFPKSEAIFYFLEKLEYLSISRTEFVINKNTFSGLKNLQNLILSHNEIHTFPGDSFEDLAALNHLQITENALKNIDNIPFCELESLRKLNLSNNAIEDLFSNYLICKTDDDDSSIDLSLNDQKVSISPDNFSMIDAFSSDLNNLDLSHNNVKSLGYHLNSFRYIRILNLQANQLTKIKNFNFRNLNASEEIYLNNNEIRSIDRNTFIGKDDLVRLDLSNNKLNNLMLDDLSTLKYFNLGYNNLTEKCLRTINSSSLEVFLLNNNNISDIEAHIFTRFPNLRQIDLSNNHIALNNDSFRGLLQLKTLKLRNNAIEELPILIFETLKNLEHLDLSKNKLASFAEGNIFAGLENLLFLNLSHNYLDNLEYRLLESMKELRVLDIEDNRLHSIQYEIIISHLPLLSVLNIRSNLLSCENLARFIKFLKDKQVNYTTQHSFDVDEENIAGIYCKSDTVASLLNSQDNNQAGSTNYLLTFSIVVISISFAIITSLFVFKVYIFIKRRKCRADEFELIDE